MKTVQCNNGKRFFAIAASLMALSFLFVLSSFGTAHAGEYHFTFNNKIGGPATSGCLITVTYKDGTGQQKKIYAGQTVEWTYSKCLVRVTGYYERSQVSSGVRIEPLYTADVCQDAAYDIQWVQSAEAYQFVRK